MRFGDTAGGSSLVNFGQITSAQDYGVNLGTVTLGQGLIRVHNGGTIYGLDGSYNGSSNVDSLTNRGVLIGNVVMGNGNDVLDNLTGRIEGNVSLGDGDDVFDNRLGGMVTGEVDGGAGNDTIRSSAETIEVLRGGAGTGDILDLSFSAVGAIMSLDGSVTNGGGSVGDTYSGFEIVYGSGVGADQLRGDASANVLYGFGGNDILDGAAGGDYLAGGAGTDTLIGGDGDDSLEGGIDGDVLNGGAGASDLARYDSASSAIYTRLDGVAGSFGEAVGDTYLGIEGFVGSAFDDTFVGSNTGNEYMAGGAGNDALYGLAGFDYLAGGAGNDILYGGADADKFEFSTALNASTNVDAIMDFAAGSDDILLSQSIFAGIGATLDATEITFGVSAAAATTRIIYNQATGQLFYDADGNGAGGSSLFATVTAGTALTIADFVMV